jgi:H+-transporting ATPase
MVTGDDVAIGDQIAAQLDRRPSLVASDVFGDGTEKQLRAVRSWTPSNALMDLPAFPRAQVRDRQDPAKPRPHRRNDGRRSHDAPALKQADCGIAVSGRPMPPEVRRHWILTAPGLSTIINAVRVSRQIFERIEATFISHRHDPDIMVLVVASVVFFEFQPITAIMIVVLALLDDIPIMTIAYDNVPAAARPVRWNMHRILLFASVMGLLSLA